MNSPPVLPYPRVNRVRLLSDLKYSRPSLDSIGSIPAEASFPPESECDILVSTIVVIVVVVSCEHPLHSWLLLDSTEQSCVD
jgi:hypothetical protein